MTRPTSTNAALLLACLLFGCDGAAPAADRKLPEPAFGKGTLVGSVTLVGTPPVMQMLDSGKCHTGAAVVMDETVVTGAKGGLANAIVYLLDAPASSGANQTELVLDQVGCKYVPRVTAIQTRQPLKITTSDTVFHNVHWVSQSNGNINFGLEQPGQSRVFAFEAPEFFRVRCDVHPWMNSWVGVIDHPFFAVTDKDGRFSISRMPAGTYRVGVWHEFYGTREAVVTVSDSAPAAVRFEYAPPAR